MAASEKCIETRSWPTYYRGPIAIHAAKHMPQWAMDLSSQQPFRSLLATAGFRHIRALPRGVVIATGTLVDCKSTNRRDWIDALSEQERALGNFDTGRYGWVIEHIDPLPTPVPARGTLGLWDWIA